MIRIQQIIRMYVLLHGYYRFVSGCILNEQIHWAATVMKYSVTRAMTDSSSSSTWRRPAPLMISPTWYYYSSQMDRSHACILDT